MGLKIITTNWETQQKLLKLYTAKDGSFPCFDDDDDDDDG